MTTLGLLEADTLYDDLIPDYGSYGQMFVTFFDHLDGGLQYRYYQIKQGELPKTANECDAYLITGSKAGVYDSDPWIGRLQNWIADFHQQGAKLIGICFGHQMIAHSLGGRAAKSIKGWGVGVHTCELIDPTDSAEQSELSLLYSHQDQVETLPPSAQLLASSDFCQYAAFKIDHRVLSFQGHPEFTPAYLQRLLTRRINAIGETRFANAMTSLTEVTDEPQVGQQLLNFIYRKL
ncbi:MAG: GMP synthase [Porticoccaceae bacterium]|nr:GMP synthase [Porticoccaceae bacterium]